MEDGTGRALRDGALSAWSPLDGILRHTCDIVADLVEGTLARRPHAPTRARLAPGDRSLAVGPADRGTWHGRATAGPYGHDRVEALGALRCAGPGRPTRPGDGSSGGPGHRVHDGPGALPLTRYRAYFEHADAWLDVPWAEAGTVDLLAPDIVVLGFRNTRNDKEAVVQLRTPWASLAFALAALASFPAHPRLLGGGLLPPGFEARCARRGRQRRPAARLVRERGTR